MSNRDIKKENEQIAEIVNNISKMSSRDASKVMDLIETKNNLTVRGMWQFAPIFDCGMYGNYTRSEWKAVMTKLANQLNRNGWSLTD